MRERWGQDFCQVCGCATTFSEPDVPVCGAVHCQAAWRARQDATDIARGQSGGAVQIKDVQGEIGNAV